VGEDETGQGEEEVDADRAEPKELVQDRHKDAAGGEGGLEVVQHDPRGGDEAHARELFDEIAHARQS
jgi:hypothetical protein